MTLSSSCVYCGLPTSQPPACVCHRDLLARDPLYDLADVLTRRLEEVLMAELDAGGSVIEYDASDGDYACPECGKRYDTAGLCTGHDEAGHPAAAVEKVKGAKASSGESSGGNGGDAGPSIKELRAEAKAAGLTGYGKLSKSELEKVLAEHKAAAAAA